MCSRYITKQIRKIKHGKNGKKKKLNNNGSSKAYILILKILIRNRNSHWIDRYVKWNERQTHREWEIEKRRAEYMFSIIIIYAWLSVWILWTCEHTTHAARKRRGEKRKSRNKKRATSKTLQQQCVAAAGQDRLKLMCASAPLESAHTHSAIPPNSVYSRRIQHFVCSTPASLANTHFP